VIFENTQSITVHWPRRKYIHIARLLIASPTGTAAWQWYKIHVHYATNPSPMLSFTWLPFPITLLHRRKSRRPGQLAIFTTGHVNKAEMSREMFSQLSWLSFSYKLVKMLSVCVDVCLDVNQGSRNHCTQRLLLLFAQTY